MNDNHPEKYSSNSGYYDLPVKEPWLFGNATLTITGLTLIGAYYTIFAPFILFFACIRECCKYNKKLFSERENDYFNIADILYAIQAICVAFLKTTLIYYLIVIFSSPIVLIIIVLTVADSVFKIFRW